MKVLVYGLNYAPEKVGIGKFTGETVDWLSKAGYEVRVVTTPPYYPEWAVGRGYSACRYKVDTIAGATVHRCPVWVPRSKSAIGRSLLQLSFALSSLLPMLRLTLIWKPDVVWTTMPSVVALPVAIVAARLSGARSWVHVQDLEVDAAFELGLVKSPRIKRWILACERSLLSAFDTVSTITRSMQAQLQAKKIATEPMLFPNWVDLNFITRTQGSPTLRQELGISQDSFVALYSGNIGEKQGIEDLIAVARLLLSQKEVLVVICGDGAGRVRLERMAADVPNVRLLPLQPIERLTELLNMADIHLLPQKRQVGDLVMPSKLGGMLASGRPVVAGAIPGTELADEVEDCGIVVPPGDPVAMAEAVRTLIADPARRAAMGDNAVLQAQRHWNKVTVLKAFEMHLREPKKPAACGSTT